MIDQSIVYDWTDEGNLTGKLKGRNESYMCSVSSCTRRVGSNVIDPKLQIANQYYDSIISKCKVKTIEKFDSIIA